MKHEPVRIPGPCAAIANGEPCNCDKCPLPWTPELAKQLLPLIEMCEDEEVENEQE